MLALHNTREVVRGMSLQTEFMDQQLAIEDLGSDSAYKPSEVIMPWFRKMESADVLKVAEDKCLEVASPALAALRGVVQLLKNSCSVDFPDAATCDTLTATILDGDQVRLVTVLNTLDAAKYLRFSIEVQWVQRFFRFAQAVARLRSVRYTKPRRSRQMNAEFVNMFSDIRVVTKRLRTFYSDSVHPQLDVLFPTGESSNVITQLASRGKGLGVKIDLRTAEGAFDYAEAMLKEVETEWTQDVHGLMGVMKRDVLPDLGASTLHGHTYVMLCYVM